MIPVVFPVRSTGIGIANRQSPTNRAVDEAAALGGSCALEAAARSIRRCVQVARVAAPGPWA